MSATVINNVRRLTNLSRLVVEMASSYVFTHENKLLVLSEELERESAVLEEETLKLLFKTRISDETRLKIIDMLEASRDIVENALKLARLSKYKGLPFSTSSFDDLILSVSLEVSDSNGFDNVRVVDFEMDNDLEIIGVKRGDRWVFDIPKSFKLNNGDLMIIRGHVKDVKKFKKSI